MSPFKPSGILAVGLWAEDVRTTTHFYRDVVGLSLLPHHGERPAFDLGDGCHLVISRGKPAAELDPTRTRFPSIAFIVADLDEAVERLRAHGVELPWGVEAGAEMRWVLFYDPAGNLIEFAQVDRPAAH